MLTMFSMATALPLSLDMGLTLMRLLLLTLMLPFALFILFCDQRGG